MKINSNSHFWCLILLASIMLSLTALVFISGFMTIDPVVHSKDGEEETEGFFTALISLVSMSLLCLIAWITDKHRTIKGFFGGLLAVLGISLFFVFLWFLESLHRWWIQLPVVVIVGAVWLFLCLGFWVWLEKKIDPEREARELAFWRRIEAEHLRQLEWDRKNDADMAQIAEMDAELDAIDKAIEAEKTSKDITD